MPERELISHTRLKSFRACRRQHHYRYDLRVESVKEVPALVGGKVFQEWTGLWFNAGHQFDGTDIFASIADPYEAAKFRAMALAYHQRWQGQKWNVVATEQRFRAPIVNPDTGRESQLYELGGDIDNVVLLEEGTVDDGLYYVERKTAGQDFSTGSIYRQKLRYDPQVTIYAIGARALGLDIRGCIYDVVAKPGQEPAKATPVEKREYTKGKACKVCRVKGADKGTGQAIHDHDRSCPACNGTGYEEAPRLYAKHRAEDETAGEYGERCYKALASELEESCVRIPVVRLDDEMVEHQWDIWQTVKSLHETKLSGRHARNPDSCFLFNRPCDFYDTCWSGADIHDPQLYRIRTKRDAVAEVATVPSEPVSDRSF